MIRSKWFLLVVSTFGFWLFAVVLQFSKTTVLLKLSPSRFLVSRAPCETNIIHGLGSITSAVEMAANRSKRDAIRRLKTHTPAISFHNLTGLAARRSTRTQWEGLTTGNELITFNMHDVGYASTMATKKRAYRVQFCKSQGRSYRD